MCVHEHFETKIWPRFFVILTEVYGSSSDQLQHNLVEDVRFELTARFRERRFSRPVQ